MSFKTHNDEKVEFLEIAVMFFSENPIKPFVE